MWNLGSKSHNINLITQHLLNIPEVSHVQGCLMCIWASIKINARCNALDLRSPKTDSDSLIFLYPTIQSIIVALLLYAISWLVTRRLSIEWLSYSKESPIQGRSLPIILETTAIINWRHPVQLSQVESLSNRTKSLTNRVIYVSRPLSVQEKEVRSQQTGSRGHSVGSRDVRFRPGTGAGGGNHPSSVCYNTCSVFRTLC